MQRESYDPEKAIFQHTSALNVAKKNLGGYYQILFSHLVTRLPTSLGHSLAPLDRFLNPLLPRQLAQHLYHGHWISQWLYTVLGS